MGAMAVKELGVEEALRLFKGWFNSKMTIILIKSQYSRFGQRDQSVLNQINFLYDLEHHYARQGPARKTFLDAVRWLKAFFHVYPEGVTRERSKKAFSMIKVIYNSFGFSLNIDVRHHRYLTL